MKDQFLLDPSIVFLNHGSFGAAPRTVFAAYQHWQLELERQPVEFLGRKATELMEQSRQSLAHYLGTEADEVVYFPNPTTAINMVARNLARSDCPLRLQPGDQILTTNHEYGAMDRTWRYLCNQIGAHYVQRNIPLPLTTPQDFIEQFWSGVNSSTRIIFISHITSPTALIFPIAEICRRARDTGILTIVDGAHAPGQIPLNLNEIGADMYTGACHKWLCAPKGSAFLHVHKNLVDMLDPLVVSWGYQADPGFGSGNVFIDYHEWQGTRDLAAFLTTPTAIEFQKAHDWPSVQERCHALAVETRERITALTRIAPICPADWIGQMFSVQLPDLSDPKPVQEWLYETHQIEVPVMHWNGHTLLRISFQAYNDTSDADRLLHALDELFHGV